MTVAVRKVNESVMDAVSDVMDAAAFQKHIPQGKVVFLKVNLGWDLFIPGSVTNPAVFHAVVRKLKGHAGRLYVVESDQVLENVEKAFFKSGISRIAEEEGVTWVNLSRGERITVRPPGNKVIMDVVIPKVLTEGTVVTLPVMKTHDKTTVTLSLKNQWGCIPKMRHMYHLFLADAIADVNAAVPVKFAVMDGTIAMEGNAPKTGIPREVGIVGASSDLVALDAVFANLMGFPPREIPHLVEAEQRGLGNLETDYVGDVIEPLKPFKPAGRNLVSRVEYFCRTSFLRRLIFETPLFLLMLLGAKIYYYIYEVTKGRALRRKYRRHPLYGRYW